MEEELGKVGVNFSEDKRSLESWKVEYPFAYVFYSLKHHIEWLFGISEQPLLYPIFNKRNFSLQAIYQIAPLWNYLQ